MKKYRYSLRNQNKIADAFGIDFLNCLIKSIKKHFEENSIINEFEYPEDNKQLYPIILVENAQPHTDSTFELYITSIKFDVYNLAYKSCMG
jgi:hypothetical protein